ncbi:MAG: CDP-diacylglycerol--serine O-phosphatidyltransferase [Rickettsiales bacterium]|nr:CDP-diacylglycerol--serine O-phosphatidyltransferase [Rickettsiales bacterium]
MIKHIPNTLTCLNLTTGGIGAIFIIRGDYQLAIYFVLISALFDFFDGFAARMLKVQSDIGKELDSLADMVSFGLVPALYMFRVIESQTNHEYLPYYGLLIAAFSAIRLAKFNIDTRQSDQFIGLPTPANSILITSLAFLPGGWDLSLVASLIVITLSSLMLVANVPMIALKFKSFGWKGNEWRYLLIISILTLGVIFSINALPFIIPLYIVLSVAGNLVQSKQV